MVAPERDRSGASNSLTLDRPLTVRRARPGPLRQRHAHRLRPSRGDRAADAAAGHRDLRHQPRRQHGRRHDLFRHGRGGDRGLSARHPVDRDVARRAGGRHFRTAGRVARRARRAVRARSRPAQPVLLNVNVPDVEYEALRGFEVTRLGKRHKAGAGGEDDDAARRDGLLDRRGGRRAGRGVGHRFPRGRQPARLDHAAADGSHRTQPQHRGWCRRPGCDMNRRAGRPDAASG